DIFWFYDKLTKADTVDGGDGFDAVGVDSGDYSTAGAAAALNALTTIEQIRFYASGLDVKVNGATLTNPAITSLLTDGLGNNFDVTNARDAWSYTFRHFTNDAAITLTDQATTFDITMSGDQGLQHVAGDGDYAQINNLRLNLSAVAPASAVATVNIDSGGDLAAGVHNDINNLYVKVGSTINITGDADLNLYNINPATFGEHVTVDASTFTGNLLMMGTDQINGVLATGDVIKLGSGSDTVRVNANSSGFTDAATMDLKTDTIVGFQAGAGGDVLDHLGADYTYTAMSATGQAAIDALGSGTTLQIAADTATANITATTEWTAFTFQGHTYAFFNGDGNATFDTGVDTLVELVGVQVADLTGANFL
ncbi:MAG: hypothetical protein J0H99_00930, partial [Rhodospirillales bacterium]|nr:hypothetical protein [Rhodospirillales bacterium]